LQHFYKKELTRGAISARFEIKDHLNPLLHLTLLKPKKPTGKMKTITESRLLSSFSFEIVVVPPVGSANPAMPNETVFS